MMIKKILFFLLLLAVYQAVGQQEIFDDYLGKEFHQGRRAALRAMLPKNSVAVFFANPIRNRANDVDYHYHQDPDFYYLTGYKEPHAVFLLFSDNQKDEQGEYNEILFVQPKNPQEELWTGIRMGEQVAKEKLGFARVEGNQNFANAKIDFKALDRILFFKPEDDIRDNPKNDSDLFDLLKNFKQKIGYQPNTNPIKSQLYELIRTSDMPNSANVANIVGQYIREYADLQQDDLLQAYFKADNDAKRAKVAKKVVPQKLDQYSLPTILAAMREIKTPEEIRLIRKAAAISAVGQIEVMKAMQPDMSELQVQAIHEYVFKSYNAEQVGYPSIVGAGHNGCVLHYIDNHRPKVDNDLVLMDLGAEYRHYTADLTRTIPANGKFSDEQKAIYELVLEAQEAGIKVARKGNSFSATHFAAFDVIADGLKKLGIAASPEEASIYFPHGTSHHIGLDVHDRSNYGKLQAGMIITVEPGIYIPKGSKCDPKWWGIAVRIEDDILITENSNENLTKLAPRTVQEIEALMAQPSVLNSLQLPDLK